MATLMHGPEKRYANALFTQAGKDVSGVRVGVDVLLATFAAAPTFQAYLASPLVKNSEKVAALSDVLKAAKAPKVWFNFVALLGQESRLDMLSGIVDCLTTMLDKAEGRVTAQVATATALTASQRKAIEAQVKALDKTTKDVTIAEKVVPSLIAGARVQVGSRAWDATLRAHLNALKQHLMH
ncbi:MAG: ATP synthase F1 subunit delta [Alphaproteobacteria bacterium]